MIEEPINEQDLKSHLGRLRIISIALIAGIVVFLGIAIYMVFDRQGGLLVQNRDIPIISIMALAMFCMMLLINFILPEKLTQLQVKQIATGAWAFAKLSPNPEALAGDTNKLLAVYQAKSIIIWALLEGPAFLGCMAYLMEATTLGLGVGCAALLAMLFLFPSKDRLVGWLNRQTSRINEIRREQSRETR